MKKSTISTKIKVIGILFTLLMASIVATTIYLNNKNEKDAMIVNIAGKQRMLSQNISKNIFYIYSNPASSFDELIFKPVDMRSIAVFILLVALFNAF